MSGRSVSTASFVCLLAILSMLLASCAPISFVQEIERPTRPPSVNQGGLRLTRDEFQSIESPFKRHRPPAGAQDRSQTAANALKKVLLRYKLNECCPSWNNLSQMQEVQEEQRRLFGGRSQKSISLLKRQELLGELKRAFFNITYLSIDGRTGEGPWEKYYKFYDDVQYYLRLMIVAENYLEQLELEQLVPLGNNTNHVGDPSSAKLGSIEDDIDFRRQFKRQIGSIKYKISQDPIISSFLSELLATGNTTAAQDRLENVKHKSLVALNENFELYETFIRYTEFGHHYARNISMVRESVQVIDQLCAHLAQINFPSNFTRPSKQYEMIRRMSYELYRIRHDLLERINLRILSQHPDLKRIFNKMNDLVAERPEIRMLGDEFGSLSDQDSVDASEDPAEFSQNVRQLAHLLDCYTLNNMTQLTFYTKLSELPEDFITLGLTVAREYETKELPQHDRFLNQLANLNSDQSDDQRAANGTHDGGNATSTSTADNSDSARQSNRPFLSKLFG